ncbi:MAG TPA: CoA ester lyase [Stellaceae bacterium]|nr:CoA ester lyase [Stellaceae bacterium]
MIGSGLPVCRPRRSVLFVPGANPRALEKARDLPADGVILDLEDAVAPAAKAAARAAAAKALMAGGYRRRERVLRINSPDSPWGEADLAAAADLPVDAVLLPKVETVDQVRAAVSRLDGLGAPKTLSVWCMLETPRGILAAPAIAAASPRLAVLVAGTSDLTKDLHALHTRDRAPVMPALGLVLLAARANGLGALDGVHLDLADEAGFVEMCRQGRALGFDGKTLIHPKQIGPANAAFAPTSAEVAWARRVVAAHAEAEARHAGVTLLDGRLVENLHVEDARRVMAIAEMIAHLDSGAAASG